MSETIMSDDALSRAAATDAAEATKIYQAIRKMPNWPWRQVDLHHDNFRRQIARATTWADKANAAREARRFFEALADTNSPEHRQLMRDGNNAAVFAPPGLMPATPSNTVGAASGLRVAGFLGALAARGCTVTVTPDSKLQVTNATALNEVDRRQLAQNRAVIIDTINHTETF